MRNGRELVGDRDQQNAAVGTRCRFRGRGAAKDAILPAPHTMSLTTGQRPGPYEILASIGAGGMGEVYRARDTRLDRDVAIKVLPEGLSRDASFKLRFEREAKAISALNHPNICTLHDIGREGELDYLVMEYIEGESLADGGLFPSI